MAWRSTRTGFRPKTSIVRKNDSCTCSICGQLVSVEYGGLKRHRVYEGNKWAYCPGA